MRPARERRDHPVVADAAMAGAGAAMAGAAGTVVAAAMVDSEEAIKIRKSRSAENWAGLDSNQRRRKASRFTVCPVWPLRYLPVSASVDIGSRCAPRKWFGHRRPPVAVALFAVANPPFAGRGCNLLCCEFDDWHLRNKTAVFQPKQSAIVRPTWRLASRTNRCLKRLHSRPKNETVACQDGVNCLTDWLG